MKWRLNLLVILVLFISSVALAQQIKWDADGNNYTKIKDGSILRVNPKTDAETLLIKKEELTPAGGKALLPQFYSFSNDNSKLLIFTNTEKVLLLLNGKTAIG